MNNKELKAKLLTKQSLNVMYEWMFYNVKNESYLSGIHKKLFETELRSTHTKSNHKIEF